MGDPREKKKRKRKTEIEVNETKRNANGKNGGWGFNISISRMGGGGDMFFLPLHTPLSNKGAGNYVPYIISIPGEKNFFFSFRLLYSPQTA
jgi:hypothetical protein